MRMGPPETGERWTAEDDALLLALLHSKTERILIGRRLKRSPSAIQTRINILRKRRELARTRLRAPGGCETSRLVEI